jgi:Zn-dependent peptidase ImmA (M78 family)/DNA-binding XRE family transcriptional regulator
MPAVKGHVLQWARESAGLGLDDAARAVSISVDRLEQLESGAQEPSRAMLIRMAKQYRRSLLTLYLSNPPRRGERGEDFRTLPIDRSASGEALVDALLRDIKVRQGLAKAVLEDDEEAQPVAFIGTAHVNGTAPLVSSIQQTLGISREAYRAARSAESAFAYLRRAAEAAGVFVLLIGDLGSHHTAIPVESFRGFADADPLAPFIVINDHDARVAWSFTLLHELAHLWLGKTGVSGTNAERAVEQFCNDVAGEILVSSDELGQLTPVAGDTLDAVIGALTEFARTRHVSRQMVAYKLYRAGRIDRDRWVSLNGRLKEIWAEEQRHRKDQQRQEEAGPSYYVVKRHRLGDALLDLTRRALDEGILPPTKAARLLGVKPRSVIPLLGG